MYLMPERKYEEFIVIRVNLSIVRGNDEDPLILVRLLSYNE